MKKWIVSVLSTAYDLQQERKAAIQILRENGFEPLAFEEPDFVQTPGEHSHYVCLDAINEADICVLIINERYGGILYGESDISITEKEYETAVLQGKPMLIFVNQKTWDARYHWKTEISNLVAIGFTDDEARKAVSESDSYANQHKVLEFIDKIHRASKDNYLHFYSNSADFERQLVPALEALSRSILLKVVSNQSDRVRQMKTSVALEMSLGDVFRSKLYVESPYVVSSGKINKGKLIEAIVDNQYTNNTTLLLGDLGMGKSTAICGAFLKHVEQVMDRKNELCIPLFLSLSGKGQGYIFNFERYISDAFADTGKERYPLLSYKGLTFCFYFDSFDELCSNMQDVDYEAFFAPIEKLRYVIACRTKVAEECFSVTEGSKFRTIIKLQKWDDLHVRELVSASIKGDETKRNLVLKKMEAQEFAFVKESPLYTTLFVWVFQQIHHRGLIGIRNDTDLLKLFMECFSKRESQRAGQKINNDLLLKSWKKAVWMLYCEGPSNVEDLLELVKIPKEHEPHFLAPFVIDPLREVHRMFHQHISDYLVAEYCIESMEDGIVPIGQTLAIVIKPEINRMIREIINGTSKSRAKKCIKNLTLAFSMYSKKMDEHLQILSNIAYYITRISHEKCMDEIRVAQEAMLKVETHPTIVLSIYFGFVKAGRLDYEEKLYSSLGKSDFSDYNRGYHLTYYSDQKDDKKKGLPYSDLGGAWSRTYQALKNHLIRDELRYVCMRRVELLTIKHFIEHRKRNDYLAEKEILEIGKHIESDAYPNESFKKQVIEQWNDLIRYLKTLAC